jgi:DNA-binding Lrp family transcriptional regulator
MRITLDAIDRRILNTLQQEGRITNQDLAERVGLSPSACLRRVQVLEGEGVIEGYSALVSPGSLGFMTTVLVQITLERQTGDYLTKFEDAVRSHPRVMECNLMSGASDYLLRVLVRDAEDYEKLHKEVLSNLPGVARIQSNFALRTVVRRTSILVT